MTTGFARKTVIPVIFLLVGTSVLAAEQKGTAASAVPAVKESASAATKHDGKAGGASAGETGAAATEEKERAVAAESPTITMRVPLFSAEFAKVPVATINGENITMEELTGALGSMHQGKAEQKTATRKNYSDVLNRLISIKLMIQEAKNIGFDKSPEVKSNVDQFAKAALRGLLFKERTEGVKVDEKEVEKAYRERIKEWKIASIRFTKEADAKKMAQEMRGGKKFDDLLDKAVKDGLAQGSKEAGFQQGGKLLPQLREALERMKAGSVSPVIPVESGFVIVRLEEVRFPENPETREQARQDVLNSARQMALDKYRAELYKKYVKINTKVLKKLDFEAPKPGFDALLKDKRTIATIPGEKPVTVADLAAAISEKFFHGMDLAIKEKKVNAVRDDMLKSMLDKKVIMKEALLKKIDKSDQYREQVKNYEDSVVFGVFIEKVVRPDVRVSEDEGKKYYQEHIKEFTYPGMIRINGLAFNKKEAAQACAEKLRQGVDFKWLKSNAEGQVAQDASDVIQLAGDLVATTSLPDDLRKALSGAQSGDVKVHADGNGHFYALQIKDSAPPQEIPYDEAKQTILPKIYDANVNKAVEEWVKKLRAASDIRIYADLGEIK